MPVLETSPVRLYHGDCREILPTLKSQSVDAVITDPPYPCIKRDYGYWTEEEWFNMMRVVVPECMRILKPTGSAMFILQPNSQRLGRMRTWLWEFMVWVGKEWGVVQDAYWLNTRAIPEAHSIQGKLMRPSLKSCVWVGNPDCYRNQDAVLWEQSTLTKLRSLSERARAVDYRFKSPGGHGASGTRFNAAEERGGVTPFNVYPADHGNSQRSAGGKGHSAGTPVDLCRFWIRYISPQRGIVLDPFSGSGSTLVESIVEGRRAIGIEKEEEYIRITRERIANMNKD